MTTIERNRWLRIIGAMMVIAGLAAIMLVIVGQNNTEPELKPSEIQQICDQNCQSGRMAQIDRNVIQITTTSWVRFVMPAVNSETYWVACYMPDVCHKLLAGHEIIQFQSGGGPATFEKHWRSELPSERAKLPWWRRIF